MKVISDANQLSKEIESIHNQGLTVGFVPTMGALHAGHISLVEKALSENDLVVASIFVNPLQFNNREDFEKYPSTLTKDADLLRAAGCHLLFHPSYAEVYPDDTRKAYDLGQLDDVMEGPFRPDHFNGVVNVVMRFFELIRPERAYFGLKDYQQYVVIRTVTASLMPGTTIVGVETMRDENGIAMSSRNMRLTPSQYESASLVPPLMKNIRKKLEDQPVDEVKQWLTDTVNSIPELRLEYIEIADGETLQPVRRFSKESGTRAFIAFYAGDIRLIDNMAL